VVNEPKLRKVKKFFIAFFKMPRIDDETALSENIDGHSGSEQGDGEADHQGWTCLPQSIFHLLARRTSPIIMRNNQQRHFFIHFRKPP
jgi:hypothetical protein